jgi:hypothetical protein
MKYLIDDQWRKGDKDLLLNLLDKRLKLKKGPERINHHAGG